jgi:hypothetical protein
MNLCYTGRYPLMQAHAIFPDSLQFHVIEGENEDCCLLGCDIL